MLSVESVPKIVPDFAEVKATVVPLENVCEMAVNDRQLILASSAIAQIVLKVICADQEELQSKFERMKEVLRNFFEFVRLSTNLSLAELIYSIWLVSRFSEKEAENKFKCMNQPLVKEQCETVINESNIGTVLLVSLEISQKVLRDRAKKNTYWAHLFDLSVENFNRSEAAYLKWLDYSVWLDEEIFNEMFQAMLL
ncbi:MAG: hypothetical protein EZS28_016523 [Streblomastix strix]|uniref:Cyclin N-terminal domain-containing protein n=1 Tax=Streblomastix strix TaxID=222440 RepID=A0A5J4VZF3_9EUKA|nr:MAG: hypothetical protein EZS28_016523 [Streblomastix strix]